MYKNREGILVILEGSYEFAHTPTKHGKETFLYVDYIGHTFCDNRYCLLRSSYSHFLVMYLFSGQAIVETEGKHYEVSKNQAFLIDTSKPHIYGCSEKMEVLWCHFDGVGSEELFRYLIKYNNNSHVFSFQENSKFLTKLGELLYSFTQNGSLYSHHYITEFSMSVKLYELLQLLLIGGAPKTFSPIDEVIQYIRQSYENEITLNALAKIAKLSVSRFSVLFKRETGMSPYQYVQNTRLHIACHLLSNSESSVEEIALKVGFSTPTLFITAFKQKYGTTPNKYRKEHSYVHAAM